MKLSKPVFLFIFLFTAIDIFAQPAEKIDSIFSSLYAKNKFNGNVLIAEKGKTDKFFLKVVDAQLEFTKDSKAQISGREIEAIKLK